MPCANVSRTCYRRVAPECVSQSGESCSVLRAARQMPASGVHARLHSSLVRSEPGQLGGCEGRQLPVSQIRLVLTVEPVIGVLVPYKTASVTAARTAPPLFNVHDDRSPCATVSPVGLASVGVNQFVYEWNDPLRSNSKNAV